MKAMASSIHILHHPRLPSTRGLSRRWPSFWLAISLRTQALLADNILLDNNPKTCLRFICKVSYGVVSRINGRHVYVFCLAEITLGNILPNPCYQRDQRPLKQMAPMVEIIKPLSLLLWNGHPKPYTAIYNAPQAPSLTWLPCPSSSCCYCCCYPGTT